MSEAPWTGPAGSFLALSAGAQGQCTGGGLVWKASVGRWRRGWAGQCLAVFALLAVVSLHSEQ